MGMFPLFPNEHDTKHALTYYIISPMHNTDFSSWREKTGKEGDDRERENGKQLRNWFKTAKRRMKSCVPFYSP